MRKSYHVEQKRGGRWYRLAGSEGNRSYVLGWLGCVCSYYPRAPHRAVDQNGDVIDHDGGAGAARPREHREAVGGGVMRPWQWPRPRSWREVYAVILGLLVGFLAVAYALDWLKGVL